MSQQQPPDPQLVALIAAYQAQTLAVRERVLRFIETLWRSLGSYRTAQLPLFTGQVIPVVLGAERHTVSLTASYLATYRQLSVGGTGTPVAVDPLRVTGSATRQGVTPQTVYERPFQKVWRDISNGVPPETAIDRGLKNAQKSATSDVQRTKVLTSGQVLTADTKATWYERVLEGPHSCGLCIVASTQRYRKTKLLPIHPGCDCGVAPRYGDPADEPLNLPRLQDVHAAIEATFGESSPAAREIPGAYLEGKPVAYRDVLIEHQHGELGTVLAVRGHQFTGPHDLP